MSERAEKLHASPWRGVFFVTGGGTELLSEMLTTAGASKTVLDAQVPYAPEALARLLGRHPEQSCSDPTARALAMAAFQRAHALAGRNHEDLFGLSCTASLATDRVKRGQPRAHIAVQTAAKTAAFSLEFDRTADRARQEKLLVESLWAALAETLGIELNAAATFDIREQTPAKAHWQALIVGEKLLHAPAAHDGKLLFPGAFNPLHHAHETMLSIAEQKTGLKGAYELSITNVDKPPLDYTEIARRLEQFSAPIWLTRLPTFLEKARQFEAPHFVLGVDTLIRLIDAGYYGGATARDAALQELIDRECRFVVFGRHLDSGWQSISDVTMPAALAARCIEVPQAEFAIPISSTELREQR